MKKKSIAAIMLACALSACSLATAGCNLGGHTHVWADRYSHDATNHWYACTVEGCAARYAENAHSYETQNGKQVCVACGYEQGSGTDSGSDSGSGSGTGTDSETPTQNYTVKFYNGDVLIDTQTVKEGGKVTEPSGLEKNGYILSGWAQGSASGAAFDLETAVTQNLSLYAVWTLITADSGITYSYAGNECAAFEWGEATPASAKVEYKLSTSSAYTAVDEELIRSATDNVARVDIVGLKGGATYDFKITTSAGKTLVSQKEVFAYDRSGYAHFNYTSGVGAYNDDGTPKSGANIVYVTEETKNTVQATIDGTTYTGIVSILQNAGTTTPLIVRIIGTVGAATWESGKLDYNKNGEYSASNPISDDLIVGINGKGLEKKNWEQQDLIDGGYNVLDESVYSELKGLNSKIKWDSSKTEYDSCWNDCNISNVKNVTVEGIGEDARIFQWGMTFKNCNSIEVRNLTFEDYTEDACSFEGSETSASDLSSFKSKNFWLHHNTFEEGVNYWDVCSEQDKHDGDGSTDFKGLSNVTIAYNVYNGTHKTGLVGGSNSQTTASITFHHNMYQACKARLPLARQANMHMYNNYYKGTTSCAISLRANAYALIENCYFETPSGKTSIELQTDATNGNGSAKLINCEIDQSQSKNVVNNAGSDNIYIGTDRTKTVTNTNKFGTAFDVDSSIFYYDSANNVSNVAKMHTAAETKTIVPQLAGVQKHGGLPDDITGGNDSGGSEESAVDMSAIYATLSAAADKIYENDFSSGEGTKLAQEQSAAGVYSKSTTEDTDYTEIKDGKAVQVTASTDSNNKVANTITVIKFGTVSSSVEGYFEMSTSDIGTKWNLISFVNADGNAIAVRIDTAITNPLTYYIGSTATEPSKTFVWAKETTYKVYYKIDLSAGKINVVIEPSNDSSKRFDIEVTDDGFKTISGIQLTSSNAGLRTVTLDNVVFCGS